MSEDEMKKTIEILMVTKGADNVKFKKNVRDMWAISGIAPSDRRFPKTESDRTFFTFWSGKTSCRVVINDEGISDHGLYLLLKIGNRKSSVRVKLAVDNVTNSSFDEFYANLVDVCGNFADRANEASHLLMPFTDSEVAV